MGRKAKPDSKALVHIHAQATALSQAPPDKSTKDDPKRASKKSEPPPGNDQHAEPDAATGHLHAPKQSALAGAVLVVATGHDAGASVWRARRVGAAHALRRWQELPLDLGLHAPR
eukprot:2911655-Pleurochrysis_carterae.AAC.1